MKTSYIKTESEIITFINKTANTLRLIGILMALTSSVSLIVYRSDSMNYWDLFTITMLCVFAIGCSLICIGEFLWKYLVKNTETKSRSFFFKDEE